ncbi:hypothetical protein JG687_00002643, partial [Phytophthora cactorum]
MLRRALVAALTAQTVQISLAATIYKISASYLGDQCDGTPYAVYASTSTDCTATGCSPGSSNINADMQTIDCSTDYIQAIRDKFGSSPYLIKQMNVDETCSTLSMAFGYPASGTCVGAYDRSYYVVASLNKNGSASVKSYNERSCLSSDLYQIDSANKTTLEQHLCDAKAYSWYSSNDVESSNSGSNETSVNDPGKDDRGPHDEGLSTAGIIVIVLGLSAFVATIVAVTLFVYKRRIKAQALKDTKATTLNSDRSSVALLETPGTGQSGLGRSVLGKTGLWDDDVITAKRIPRDKVQTQKLISRGAFGEVYAGIFNGQQVAIKVLLPSTRTNLKQVNEFLAEAKMNATMDHPHIVAFVGVAWDSLSDLCVVLEYMHGGELRALLDQYLKSKHPVGFNKQKATTALQVCHALTYLHSLDPPVVHRDLKSRNILFSSDMEAKLSDFGISRERLDQTMTAGVGTSLWMAPEVMMGERYDDKADMFSFGVVLSELDVHTMPYAQAKKETLQSSGRAMVDSRFTVLRALALTAVVHTGRFVSAAKMYSISASYLGDQCGGTPYAVNISRDDNCTIETCSPSSNTSSADMITVVCALDYIQATRDKFGSSPYIIELVYGDENCSYFGMGYGYPASGTCVGGYTANDSYYVIASLHKDGSASLELFPDRSCLSESIYSAESGDKEAVETHECDANWFRWYSSNDVLDASGSALTSGSSGDVSSAALSNGDILGIVLGSFVFLMVFLVAVFLRQRQKAKANESTIHSLSAVSAASLEATIRGQTGLWNDDIITTKRIPRDKVQTEKLVSRGSFGEVYAGVFNGHQVAVKVLPSSSRDNITLVNEFLAEAKMTATMDHPHIVSFVGVAWDSLTDLCVVLEYMDGGELRSLLNNYLESKKPVGFNREKATIALQVCHALTYLHSLMPSVIHRDLKSRNILLDSNMKAKLSDFGISRERLDRTMTAGVGTSLWMAPEVMLGEHYDDKADMFSFGVVLSELDVHTLPYARAKKENLDSNGREMIDSILLQKVALGTLQ